MLPPSDVTSVARDGRRRVGGDVAANGAHAGERHQRDVRERLPPLDALPPARAAAGTPLFTVLTRPASRDRSRPGRRCRRNARRRSLRATARGCRDRRPAILPSASTSGAMDPAPRGAAPGHRRPRRAAHRARVRGRARRPENCSSTDRAQEVAHVAERSHVDEPTGTQDADPVAQRLDLREDVRRQEYGLAVRDRFGDAFTKCAFHQRVEARGRFVEHEQIGAHHEGGDQGDLLAVALRQYARLRFEGSNANRWQSSSRYRSSVRPCSDPSSSSVSPPVS